MSKGVEQQAKLNAPQPPPGKPNTSVSDRVAAIGRNPNIPAVPSAETAGKLFGPSTASPAAVAPTAATAGKLFSGPDTNPLGGMGANPLGGMDSRPLSARGPMATVPRGVGTTNPNSYATGKKARQIMDMSAAAKLFPATSPASPGLPNAADAAKLFPAPTASGTRNVPDPTTIFGPQKTDPNAEFWNQQHALMQETLNTPMPAEAAAPSLFALEGAGGFVPMLRQPDGSAKAAGGFFPGAAPDPFSIPQFAPGQEPPQKPIKLPLAQIADSQDYVPTFEGKPIPGLPIYNPKQAPMPLPAGVSGPPKTGTQMMPQQPQTEFKIETEGGDLETVIKDGMKSEVRTPKRHYYFTADPKTGEPVKRYVKDANGDGVPDDQQSSSAKPANWADWLKGKL